MAEHEGIRVLARAKLNLFLRILSREASGYHGIETLFTLIDLADEITIRRAKSGVTLTVEGAETGPEQDNLVVRAAELVLKATGQSTGLAIELKKSIPVRAGLGGGSSDGAATLHAVNDLLGAPVPGHEILQLATKLGSDVAFFAARTPMALGWNRGERLFRVTPPPQAPALLVIPPFGISTPEAYSLVDASRTTNLARGSVVLDVEAFGSWGGIARLGGNDFESVLFSKHSELQAVYEGVAATRPLLVRMSGSGSTIAAIYRSDRDRDEAVVTLPPRVGRIIRTATVHRVAPEDARFL